MVDFTGATQYYTLRVRCWFMEPVLPRHRRVEAASISDSVMQGSFKNIILDVYMTIATKKPFVFKCKKQCRPFGH